MFNYDIQTGQRTEFLFVTGPFATGERTYGRFLYDPINNIFFLIESIPETQRFRARIEVLGLVGPQAPLRRYGKPGMEWSKAGELWISTSVG